MIERIYRLGKKIWVIGPRRALYVASYRAKRYMVSADTPPIVPVIFKKLRWLANYHLSEGQELPPLGQWHRDSHTGHTFEWGTYYKDIVINEHPGPGLGPDIKIPWELSRFQFLPFCTQEQFESIINDWLIHNPYERGINWLCPMEVGIRAINWIIALQFFYEKCDPALVQKIIISLYEHMRYLENNWELADGRTSNHYLSDLVGYLYCAWFFDDTKKQQWVMQKIEEEMAWQVFDEGTSYEGSTSYHRLVTELFTHAHLMARECHLNFSDMFNKKLHKMHEFVSVCDGVTIGDDDSGRVSCFNVLQQKNVSGLFNYSDFGLALIKTDIWHMSLRSHAYHPRQPSGHFHDDAGSITLSYKGIAVLVDPGSFVYTASAQWRDYFRSPEVHNKVYKKNHTIVSQSDMFTLKLPEKKYAINTDFKDKIYRLETVQMLDDNPEHNIHIKVECDALRNCMRISYNVACDAMINLTFGIGVSLQKIDDGWLILHEGKKILHMQTDIAFEQYEGWVAPAYGVKESVVGLRGDLTQNLICTYFQFYEV